MRAFDGQLMLMAWERFRNRTAPERALMLLELANPEESSSSLSMLPLAERNALLLELREMTFGTRMEGFAPCMDCGSQLEFALDTSELARGLQEPERERDDLARIAMRPANTEDLLACLRAEDEQQARSILLARTMGLDEIDSSEVPQEWIDRFDVLNAAAEIRLEMRCPSCSGSSMLDLDIVSFLVREVTSAARRLMAEIHELAGAYGWSERDITAMSAVRRAAYLEMLNA